MDNELCYYSYTDGQVEGEVKVFRQSNHIEYHQHCVEFHSDHGIAISGEDCRRCLRPQVRGRTSTLRPRLRQGSLQGDTFYINIQIEGQISVSTWRIFLHLTTDGHVSRSATTSQNSRRPHQASPWTPRLDCTIFRDCLKHA